MEFQNNRYAGIDIGSNGVRLLIVNVYKEGDRSIFNKTALVRAPIRLGVDSFHYGKIKKVNIKKLSKAMIAFKHLMDCYGVEKYRACATSALREAKNGIAIAEKISRKSGINIELISGKEEAKILYVTQLKSVLENGKDYLLIDVGGGSTEITYLKDKKPINSKSFKIGTVRLKEDLVKEKSWEKMRKFLESLEMSEDCVAMGTGGNINTLFKLKSSLGVAKNKSYLSREYIHKVYQDLKLRSISEIKMEYNFKPDRADVITHALNIYLTAIDQAGLDKVIVPKLGLADGLVRMMHEEN